MASNPPPVRPWFRLASMARPPAPAAPVPEPAAPLPRPPLARPTFRPLGPPPPPAAPQPQPIQPQEPTAPPPAATLPPPTTTPPAQVAATGVASVPTSPIQRASAPSASVPTSPATKTLPATTILPATVSSSSLPPSPKPKVFAPSTSLPTSPTPKAAPTSSSVPTSPIPKLVPTSPPKAAPISSPKSTSPAPKIVPSSASVPTSPVPKSVTSIPATAATTTTTTTFAPSSASLSTSPAPKSVNATSSVSSYIRTIKPTAQTPPQSPKTGASAPPPSPLNLPPPQLKFGGVLEPQIPIVAEQKTVLVQKTIEKPKPSFIGTDSQRDVSGPGKINIANGGKHQPSKDTETKEKDHHHKKLTSDSDEAGMKVITIAGENRGAFMEIMQSPKKHVFEGNSHFLHNHGNPRTLRDGEEYSSSSDEENAKKKDKSHKAKGMPSPPMKAFMNSNVQGVNNSIVYNSSYTHHDPGVHVALSRKPSNGGFDFKDRGNGNQS